MVVPRAMLGSVGVTSIDTSVTAVTVREVLPVFPKKVAVMVACPAAMGVVRPLEPAVLLTTATASSDELQVTDAVMSWVVLSE